MLRAISMVVLAWLSSAGAPPACAQQATQITIPEMQRRNAEEMAQREKALNSAEEKFQPDHPDLATALNNLAESHRFAASLSKDDGTRQKEAAIAEAMHGRALAIREKVLGLRHSFTLASMVNLAHVYQLQRRYDDAEAMYQRAIEILTEIGPRAGILMELARQATAGRSQIDRERGRIEASAQRQAVARQSYANPDHRWSISYPTDWKLDDRDRLDVRISRGPAILGIHTYTDVAGKSLDQVADAILQRWEQNMRSVNVFTQISRQRLTLPDNLPAIEVVHHIGRGVLGRSRKVIAVVKERAFWIDAEASLLSWPDYEGDFNRMVESFRVQE